MSQLREPRARWKWGKGRGGGSSFCGLHLSWKTKGRLTRLNTPMHWRPNMLLNPREEFTQRYTELAEGRWWRYMQPEGTGENLHHHYHSLPFVFPNPTRNLHGSKSSYRSEKGRWCQHTAREEGYNSQGNKELRDGNTYSHCNTVTILSFGLLLDGEF